jgi:hypothetical protein
VRCFRFGTAARNRTTSSALRITLANGRTQPEIAAACKGARPNHVGAAIARYKRAGRIEERDGKLYASYRHRLAADHRPLRLRGDNYPAGTGLVSGATFARIAGRAAAKPESNSRAMAGAAA